MNNHSHLKSDLNTTKVQFLRVDLDTALTFAQIASQAGADTEKRSRNLANATYAYDMVPRMTERVTLTKTDARVIEKKLKQLKSVLEQLGAL